MAQDAPVRTVDLDEQRNSCALADGTALSYRLDGPAASPVLVLSNSLGTRLEMWQPQLPAFSRQFRLLRYDSRGHGASSGSAGPYTIGRLALDVIALLDVLRIPRAHFSGLSM